jgi:hypothetical protein
MMAHVARDISAEIADPEPNWFGRQWGSPHSINAYRHPDAKYEMRSEK